MSLQPTYQYAFTGRRNDKILNDVLDNKLLHFAQACAGRTRKLN